MASRRVSKGGHKTRVGDLVFDSKIEAGRYVELWLLEKAGKIRGLELQPSYDLFASTPSGREKIGRYTADFRYEERQGGHWKPVTEDVKAKRVRRKRDGRLMPDRADTAFKLRQKVFEANQGLALTIVRR